LKRFVIALSALAILGVNGCGGTAIPEGTPPDAKGYVAPFGMDPIAKPKDAAKKSTIPSPTPSLTK